MKIKRGESVILKKGKKSVVVAVKAYVFFNSAVFSAAMVGTIMSQLPVN